MGDDTGRVENPSGPGISQPQIRTYQPGVDPATLSHEELMKIVREAQQNGVIDLQLEEQLLVSTEARLAQMKSDIRASRLVIRNITKNEGLRITAADRRAVKFPALKKDGLTEDLDKYIKECLDLNLDSEASERVQAELAELRSIRST